MQDSLIITTARANYLWTKDKMIKYMKEKKAALSSADTATCKELINLFVKRIILTTNDIFIVYRFVEDSNGVSAIK